MDQGTFMGTDLARGLHLCTLADRREKEMLPQEGPQYGELWEDIYGSWVRYKLKLPLEGGELQSEDVRIMKDLWGHSLEIS